jgi:hypothetical protein
MLGSIDLRRAQVGTEQVRSAKNVERKEAVVEVTKEAPLFL